MEKKRHFTQDQITKLNRMTMAYAITWAANQLDVPSLQLVRQQLLNDAEAVLKGDKVI